MAKCHQSFLNLPKMCLKNIIFRTCCSKLQSSQGVYYNKYGICGLIFIHTGMLHYVTFYNIFFLQIGTDKNGHITGMSKRSKTREILSFISSPGIHTIRGSDTPYCARLYFVWDKFCRGQASPDTANRNCEAGSFWGSIQWLGKCCENSR